jgi:FkbM family methyltransferase
MLTLFTTAKPFRGHSGIIHRNALKSWTLLHPDIEIILFGDDEGAAEVRRLSDVARELNLRHPLLLKPDVQGFEDKVIIGGEDVVARAKIVIIEVSFQSLFEGGPLI